MLSFLESGANGAREKQSSLLSHSLTHSQTYNLFHTEEFYESADCRAGVNEQKLCESTVHYEYWIQIRDGVGRVIVRVVSSAAANPRVDFVSASTHSLTLHLFV